MWFTWLVKIANKLRDAYRRASKRDKARILDEVMATTGMGRSTARRMLTGPVLPDPAKRSAPGLMPPLCGLRLSVEGRVVGLLELGWWDVAEA